MQFVSLFALVLTALISPNSADNTKVITARADFIADRTIVDLTGYYICEGQEGPDKNYKGVAVITKKGDVYLIQWVIGSGTSFHGVGIRNDSTLSAAWAMPVGDKGTLMRGVNMYRIEPGPRLVGRWATAPTDGTVRSETLTFLKKLDDD
jgi:hypothetical protein